LTPVSTTYSQNIESQVCTIEFLKGCMEFSFFRFSGILSEREYLRRWTASHLRGNFAMMSGNIKVLQFDLLKRQTFATN